MGPSSNSLSQGDVILVRMFDSPNPGTENPGTESTTSNHVGDHAPNLAGLFASLDTDLCDRVVQLEGIQRQLDAERTRVVVALDADSVTEHEHGMRTGHWIAAVCGLGSLRCASHVRIAKQLLTRFPVLLAALTAATISWAHIEAIMRVSNQRIIDNLADIQSELLVLADRYTFDQWEREVRAIAQMIDVDGGHNPNTDHQSSLKLADTADGLVRIEGWLTPDLGLPLRHAIEHRANQLFHRAHSDIETLRAQGHTGDELNMPSRSELCALALADLVRAGMNANNRSQRRAIPEITVVIDTTTSSITADGTIITAELLRQLAPEAMWRYMTTNTNGDLLSLGRSRRLVTPDLRHALAIRDGGCVFPGCDAPHEHCDAHHVIHWSAGGITDPTNCALLCRYHHGITHRNRWTMQSAGHQRFIWITPSGAIIHSQRHHRTHTEPPSTEP